VAGVSTGFDGVELEQPTAPTSRSDVAAAARTRQGAVFPITPIGDLPLIERLAPPSPAAHDSALV
jgi:hypothetical protein